MLRTLLCVVVLTTACAAADFSVSGSTIRDPAGREFVPVGANVNGSDWVWNDETTRHLAKIRDGWRFNFLRVNCFMDPANTPWPTFTVNNDLQRIVDTYTPHGIVVCLELHDWTGTYPSGDQLTRMTAWWKTTAARFKGNPYVWFNIMNEPGGSGAVSSAYRDVHQAAIRAIRTDAGATNVIVVDGASWGQDTGSWNANPVPTANSGILTYGAQLKQFDGRTWDNIVFSVHCYDQWAYGDAKLVDYITRVHAAGHALFVGEFGGYGNNTTNNLHAAAQTVRNVALDRKVGIVWWHYQPGDGFSLTTPGLGSAIDSLTAPTNLTWGGQILWDATHTKGFGLQPGGGGNTAPTITAPATGSTLSVTEDAAKTLSVTASDPDAGQTLTWTLSIAPTKGTVTGLGTGGSRTLTYTPNTDATGADTFTVRVSDGTASTTRAVGVTIAAVNDAPVMTAAPTISGTAAVGQTLAAASGSWNDSKDGGSTLFYARQWQRADDGAGTNTVDIPGATGVTYTIVAGDLGKRLRVRVTVNDSGVGTPATTSASASSGWTAAVATATTASPTIGSATGTSTATPTLTGTATPGATIRVRDDGTVIGTVTASGTGAWTWTAAPPLAPGAHNLTVTAQTSGAGESAPTSPVVITAPTVSSGSTPVIGNGGGGGGGGCGAGSALALLATALLMGLSFQRRH